MYINADPDDRERQPRSFSLRLDQDAPNLAWTNQQIIRPPQIDCDPGDRRIASAAASPAASGISGSCGADSVGRTTKLRYNPSPATDCQR